MTKRVAAKRVAAKRVAVLMGGFSVERDVSLTSGAACARALAEAGYEVITFDVGRSFESLVGALTRPTPVDAVFNALHGRYGEDGRIQGVLDLIGIPYTHSGVLASALAMDKPIAKRVFAAAGIPVAEGVLAPRGAALAGRVMAPPFVIKPVAEGSSVGVTIVGAGSNLPPRAGVADESETVLVERYIPGRELTVAVMGAPNEPPRALGVTEIRPRDGFYDYRAKYTAGRADHLLPAPLPGAVAEAAMAYACEAHRACGCRGVTRADFRYDDTGLDDTGAGALFMLELNTQPGMTPLSLVPEQAAHCGMSFVSLVEWLVETARCD